MSDAADAVLANEPKFQEAITKRKFSTLLSQLWNLVSPYWKSEEKVFAWTMLAVVFGLNMASIYCAVLLNTWSASFYNALQSLDKAHFTALLGQFFIIVLALIVLFVAESFLRTYLAFKWRVWLTKQVMGDWLHNSTFSRLFTHKTKTENPDQRISQDLNTFTSSSLSLSFSIVSQLVKCVTFAIILWALSSALLLPLPGGKQLNIPGYMLWFTMIYVGISTTIIFKTGKPLVKLDYAQEKVEADFRFSLMRIRERRDEVSILNGSAAESKFLGRNIVDVIKNYKQIIKRNIYVNTFQNLFLNMTTVLPILAAAPMYFSGAITLGVLMQISNAFGSVEGALMIFALNFQTFASWKATFNRIVDFRAEMESLKNTLDTQHSDLEWHASPNNLSLVINNLTLHLPDSQELAHFNFDVKAQERVLLMGRSGMGKSTLIKCVAGLWPFANGTIQRPQDVVIIPQKPYFPIGTLRDCLLYPNLESQISDQEMQRILSACSLEILKGRLDEVHDWLSILSLGEQQRLNFARVMLAKPTWLIMDEPTASMDKDLEKNLFAALYNELPTVSLLTIGHALSLRDLHHRVIQL
ncbi:MAG TPA: ABC transporter ATP-binding protein/permease [Gammaproteobacteria bacterium]|nr:ABC transporter ATP-binding protein/permease [Gammaproteobacteria bacterium]